MKATRRYIKYASSCIVLLCSATAFSAGPADVKFFGFDWVGGLENPEKTITQARKNVIISSNTRTNMNVVYTYEALESTACANQQCAVGFAIGDNDAYNINICPNSPSHNACVANNSYQRIWAIVSKLKTIANKPRALYFFDEPYISPALKNNGVYVRWQYPSYVCTLREAMAANGVNWPIYTIMNHGVVGETADPVDPIVKEELTTQMPSSGCASGKKSTPDAVGIDHYQWTNAADVYNAYNKLIPANNPQGIKWVMVPPGTTVENATTDAALHARVQPYWDILYAYPQAPIVAYHVWKYDQQILGTNNFPMTKALLSYMGNMLTPPN